MRFTWFRTSNRADERIDRLHRQLDTWPLEAGLFGLTDHFIEFAEAELDTAAHEKFGADPLAAIARREARAVARETSLSGRTSSHQWVAVERSMSELVNQFSWPRAAFTVTAAAALWGVSQDRMPATAWLQLAIATALVLANLVALPPLIGLALRAPALTFGWLRDSIARALIRADLRVCRYRRHVAEERQVARAAWRSNALRSLTASYQHRKDLAVRATAPAV